MKSTIPGFKQEDRVHYQGRDMAVVRGNLGKFPVVLASATPSIESHVNALVGRYRHAILPGRFSGVAMPDVSVIDLKAEKLEPGKWLAQRLVAAMTETLEKGQQTLLFLNRRGYAPLTLCRSCGHRLECPQCTAWLVEHRFKKRLTCHHCGFSLSLPEKCPKCATPGALVACGPGIERVQEEVAERFPDARLALLSSDLIPGLAEMREMIRGIEAREFDIIIGTQIVAKGHNFPGSRARRRRRRRSWPRPRRRSARGRAHVPALASGHGPRRAHKLRRTRLRANLFARPSGDEGNRRRRPRCLPELRGQDAACRFVAALRPAGSHRRLGPRQGVNRNHRTRYRAARARKRDDLGSRDLPRPRSPSCAAGTAGGCSSKPRATPICRGISETGLE